MVEKIFLTLEETDADLSVCRYFINEEKTELDFGREYVKKEDYIKKMFIPKNRIAAFVWNRLYRRDLIEKYNLLFDEKI